MDKSRNALSDFTADKASALDVHKAVCQDIVDHVGSTRASIWYVNETADVITSACSLDTRTGVFDVTNTALRATDCPIYFEEILSRGVIKAENATEHPATSAMKERYIAPLNIVSMFDFAIKIGARTVAVLCCEQCEKPRAWTAADENYLSGMAVLLRISFLVEQRSPRR
ncbi:MAG: GAF domain-containing protein [Beijerinckiaceae bacterium]